MRAVARYLDEALDVYEAVNYYAEADRPGEASRLRGLAGPDLLFQLPRVQRLLLRLADCAPGGAAAGDPVVQAALLTLVKESFKAYRAASEGLINLADKFFDMDVASARSALEAYRAAVVVTARLQAFYRAAEAAPGLAGAAQFPRLEPPPDDFIRQARGRGMEGWGVGEGPGGRVVGRTDGRLSLPRRARRRTRLANPFLPLFRWRTMWQTPRLPWTTPWAPLARGRRVVVAARRQAAARRCGGGPA